jgi:high-affinity Fe2+/Pb2+ permease
MTAQPGTAPDKVATFGLQARHELERGVLLLVVAAGLLYVALKWLYRRPEKK